MPTTRNIFDGTLSDLQRWVLPSPVWRWKLNQPVDALNRMGATLPRSEQVFGPGAPIAPVIPSVEFVSWHLDSIRVRDIGTSDEPFPIALPWLLRKTPFERKFRGDFYYIYSGFTRRTSFRREDFSDEEKQEITQTYIEGDIVRVIAAVEPFVEVADEPLELEAVQVSHWAKVPESE